MLRRLWSFRSGPKKSPEPPVPPPLPPREWGVLRELTLENRFGEVEIRPDLPGLEMVEDACFVPDRPSDGWGVFNRDGEPVEASLDYNLPWNEPMWPRPVNPVRRADVSATLPDGEYIYVGFVHPHFGHFVIDSLSRMWPLIEHRPPGVKLLLHGWGGPAMWWAKEPWLVELLRGAGVSRDDILEVSEPVRVPRLWVPHRSFQGQTFAHQVHAKVCRSIGEQLIAGQKIGREDRPAYLSKTRLARGIRRVTNEHQLESFLRGRGVEVFYPETMSTLDKLALFHSGRPLAGMTSSAFHTSLFAPPAGRMVMIDPAEVVNSNFLLCDRLNGNQASYFYAIGASRRPKTNDWLIEDTFRDPIAIGRELLHLL